MEHYIQKLEGFIFDEKEVVTYKWLSRKLRIHNNIAKRVLQLYIQDTNVNEKCLVTYLIMGKCAGNVSIVIAADLELDKVKREFEEIMCEHVYSIQEKKTVIDLNTLYIADKLELSASDDKLLRSIIYHGNIRIEKPQLAVNRSDTPKPNNKIQTKNEVVNQCEMKSMINDKKNIPDGENINSVKQNKKSNKKVANQPAKQPVPKNGQIFSMWDKQKERNKNAVCNNIIGSNSPPVIHSVSESDSATEKRSEKILETEDKSKGKNKSKSSKKQKEQSKKRKRITVFSSSEEDNDDPSDSEKQADDQNCGAEIENELDSKDLQEPPNNDEILDNGQDHNKKRKRKIVDETFMDDDGFMHTKKSIVYESCSEDECDNESEDINKCNKSNAEKAEEKKSLKTCNDVKESNLAIKNQVKQKSKQASLMNFFSKPKP